MRTYVKTGRKDGFSGEELYEERETRNTVNIVTLKQKKDLLAALQTQEVELKIEITQMEKLNINQRRI